MNFLPLYIKTEYSLLSSMIRVSDLIFFAKEHGIKALSIADNNMSGVMEFYKMCKDNEIKPVIGLEVNIEQNPTVFYAKNFEGYKHLLKLSTLQSEKVVTIQDIPITESLICILTHKSYKYYSNIKKIVKDVYFSYANKKQRDYLLSKKVFKIVYMKPVLYLKKEEKGYLRYLYAIKDGVLLSQVEQLDDDYYLRYDILEKENQEILNMCNLEIVYESNLLPKYHCPDSSDPYTYLKKLCIDGLKFRFGSVVKEIYLKRLKYELEVINKMNFCNYFLVVYDYVKYAHDNGILVGPGRGSAAGSLVSYCLRITDIDPIKYNLLFERFLNPERVTMPDIDIDFEYLRRDEVISYCIRKYGSKNVAGIITFGTLASKQVIRDVGRVMNISLKQIDFLCKIIDSKKNLIANYNENEKIRNFIDVDPNLKKLYLVASKLEGLKRHSSIHAAGIIMSDVPLDTVVPLCKKDNMYVTGYSMNYLEELGLLKMDFLALKTLTTINEIINQINKGENTNLSFDTIPMDSKEALKVFNEVNTTGIFQFETNGMMNFLRKLKPDSFEDIFAAIALYRPGPMDNIDMYIRRKNGIEKIDYLCDEFIPILKSTYGILIYQEQIMQVANVMADYSFGEADVLRRAMSKKKEDILLKEKDKFIKRAVNKGFKEELVSRVYALILKFANYGFNRAHSVAYAIISYKMAYLKAIYPTYFLKSLLDSAIGDTENTKKYIYEAKANHIEILSPDINLSGISYIKNGNNLLYPLNNIKNVGSLGARQILEERKNGAFEDIYDFVKRIYGKSINKKTIMSIIISGCFDKIHPNKRTLIENIDLILNYGEVIKDIDVDYALKPILDEKEFYSKQELMQQELDLFGFYLKNNPITEWRSRVPEAISISEVGSYFNKHVIILVMVEKIREIFTKKGDKMCFMTGVDEVDTIDIVVFPKVLNRCSNIKLGSILKIKGTIERRFDKYQMNAQEIRILS